MDLLALQGRDCHLAGKCVPRPARYSALLTIRCVQGLSPYVQLRGKRHLGSPELSSPESPTTQVS